MNLHQDTNPAGSNDFYRRPKSLDEALDLLNEPKCRSRILAGGTDLINQFRAAKTPDCDRVIDVARLPELRGIRQHQGEINIGATLTHTEVMHSAILQKQAPLLVLACRQIGSPQIRNIATVGGNVMNAAACADTLPALVCMQAEAIIASTEGETRMPVADLITGVGRTQLPEGALLRAFAFKPAPAHSRCSFQRIGRRQAMSIARLSVAALAAQKPDGTVSILRLVPGAAFSRFRQVPVVEEMLLGRVPNESLVVQAGERMAAEFMAESGGRWSAPYKEKAIAVLTERALRQVLEL